MSVNGGWINVDRQGNVIGAPKPAGSGPFVDIIGAARDIRPGDKPLKKIGNAAVSQGEKLLKDAGSRLKDEGKKAIDAALKSNPVTAPFAIGADAVGLNPFGAGGWIEQLQNWIKESGIFQRFALAFLAFIFIAVALSMFGRNTIAGNLAQVVKGK